MRKSQKKRYDPVSSSDKGRTEYDAFGDHDSLLDDNAMLSGIERQRLRIREERERAQREKDDEEKQTQAQSRRKKRRKKKADKKNGSDQGGENDSSTNGDEGSSSDSDSSSDDKENTSTMGKKNKIKQVDIIIVSFLVITTGVLVFIFAFRRKAPKNNKKIKNEANITTTPTTLPSAYPSISLQPSHSPSLSAVPTIENLREISILTYLDTAFPGSLVLNLDVLKDISSILYHDNSNLTNTTLTNSTNSTNSTNVTNQTSSTILTPMMDSPRTKAVVWLLFHDEMRVDPFLNDDEIVPRFALATMHFSSQINEQYWMSSYPVCKWKGVTCQYLDEHKGPAVSASTLSSSTNFVVTQLSLSNLNLMGQIPSEIALLDSLTDLYLDHNSLTGVVDPGTGLFSIKSLQNLDLSNNDFHGQLPNEIINLKNLNALYLSFNEFTGQLFQVDDDDFQKLGKETRTYII